MVGQCWEDSRHQGSEAGVSEAAQRTRQQPEAGEKKAVRQSTRQGSDQVGLLFLLRTSFWAAGSLLGVACLKTASTKAEG